MTLDRLSLSTKMLLPVAAVVAFSTIVLIVGIYNLKYVGDGYAELVDRSDATIVKMMRANRLAAEIGYSTHVILDFQADNPVSVKAQALFKEAPAKAIALLNEAAELSPNYRNKIISFRDRIALIADRAIQPNTLALGVPGIDAGAALQRHELEQLAAAAKLLNPIDAEVQSLAMDMTAFNDHLHAESKRLGAQLAATAQLAVWLMVGAGLAALVLGVGTALWLSRTAFVVPVRKMAKVMETLARNDMNVEIDGLERVDELGDLARTLAKFRRNGLEWKNMDAQVAKEKAENEERRRQDEAALIEHERQIVADSFGAGLERLSGRDLTCRLESDVPSAYRQLQADFNSALTQLEAAIVTVAEGASRIGAATVEITGAADDLSRRTEQQAASVEETVASIAEISSTVQKTASGAKQASDVVSQTKSDAEKSGEIVQQAIDAINRIEKSSHSISQIIGVIDEISFQTNLLALNAGVEAARAGEAGKGFAVVASEVRGLAQRSAEAAKEIKDLITVSNTEVAGGVRLVLAAGEALNRIVQAVSAIDKVVAEIASGAIEQSNSLQQINVAVSQMDQDVQKNAAMVEETTAATHNLKREAEELLSSIASFRVSQDVGRAAGAARGPKRQLKVVNARQSLARDDDASVAEWAEF